MPEFYKYSCDVDRYALLEAPDAVEATIDALVVCKDLRSGWQAIECEISTDSAPNDVLGDFPRLIGRPPLPVFSEKAWNCLAPLIGQSAAPLPLAVPVEEKYFLINILGLVDALDREKSELDIEDGILYDVIRYRFKQGALDGCHLFRIPECKYKTPLVSAEFVAQVKKHGLVGAEFEPIPQ